MRSNHPSDWRKLDRDFIEDKYFVEADLNMVIKFGNDVNPAEPFGYVQRLVFLFFVLLLEVVPYFQHYRMLDKWHSLSLPLRIGAYAGFFLLQYILNRRLKEHRVGRHIAYLKELVGQMQ